MPAQFGYKDMSRFNAYSVYYQLSVNQTNQQSESNKYKSNGMYRLFTTQLSLKKFFISFHAQTSRVYNIVYDWGAEGSGVDQRQNVGCRTPDDRERCNHNSIVSQCCYN